MKDIRISVRLTPYAHKSLKKLSESKGISMNKMLNDYIDAKISNDYVKFSTKSKIRVLSLFSNIGVAEAYFNKIGVTTVVANELIKRRAKLYSSIYPDSEMICGDILDKSIFDKIISESKKKKVNLILATPPCQGMSTVGKQDPDDIRNELIVPVIEAFLELMPDYGMIENVPLFFQTEIVENGKKKLIPELIYDKLGEFYNIEKNIIDTMNYGVPQSRSRAILLLSKKGKRVWRLPEKDGHIVTMQEAIGTLPEVDPYIKDISYDNLIKLFPYFEEKRNAAMKISKWNFPPEHIFRQVFVMMHTPTGKTAFDNPPKYRPTKKNGEFVKGFKNTYKRQEWNAPAYTVTMDNRKISSQNNVHPGRFKGYDKDGSPLYSDPRVLTIYELMKISSIPDDWNLPDDTNPALLRSLIGEGIPPLFVKKVFLNLPPLRRGKQ